MQETKRPQNILREIFTFGLVSSWDVDDRGGKVLCVGHECGVLMNNTNKFPIRCRRPFTKHTDGTVVMEYRFRLKSFTDGFKFYLADGKTPAFIIESKGKNIVYQGQDGEQILYEYEEDIEYACKFFVDIDNKKLRVTVNGKDYGVYNMYKAITGIDEFIMQSPTSKPALVYFYYLHLYRDYIVNESFCSCAPGRVPYDWSYEGAYESEVFVDFLTGYDKNESYVLLIKDGRRAPKPTIVTKKFDEVGGKIVFSFNFFLSNPENKKNGVSFSLMSKGEEAVTITAKQSSIYSGDEVLRKYNKNVWQRVRMCVDLNSHTAKIFVNNSNVATLEIPQNINSVDAVQFKSTEHEWTRCQIDEVKVYLDPEPPKDYPAKPVKPKTDYYIGMQTCFLWREGIGPGWDKIECHPERKPYLGWYHESIPEKADWEIKYMCEHGISFILPCWYTSDGYSGGPYRGSSYEEFFEAKYIDYLKIALDINDFGNIGERDFYDYLVPYWLENFFTAPNYMVIDNKPVIAFLHYSLFNLFKTVENANKAMAFIREECKKAGFDGAYLIVSEQHRTPIQVEDVAKYDFDAIYSYGWGHIAHHENAQKKILEAQRDMNVVPVIPTVVQGYNDLAWNGHTAGGYITPEHFKETITWVRDEFHTKGLIPEGGLSKMLLLGNWNEYGEGHFFMPAELHGFKYLDALRNVFTDDLPHTDERPNENQLERLELMRVKGRKALKQVKTDPSFNGKVAKGWYFNKESDRKLWKATEGIENLCEKDGLLYGKVTDPNAYLYCTEELNVDGVNCAYIRIKMKHENVMSMLYTFSFTTEKDRNWDKEKQYSGWITENYVEECHAGMFRKKSWWDIIKELRLNPMASTGEFYIESIELVEYEERPTRVFAADDERRFFTDPIVENGVLLAPFEGIRDLTGAYTRWDYENNKMLVADEANEMLFTFGSTKVIVNGTEKTLDAAPVLQDRVAYLPIEFICDVLGVKTKYIADKKEFYFM